MTKRYFLLMLLWMFGCFTAYIWMFVPMFFEAALKWEVFIIVLFAPLFYLCWKEAK